MRRYLLMIALAVMVAPAATLSADDGPATTIHQAFYGGNADYQAADYPKAIEKYTSILQGGLESGPLYYNIGNAYLRQGRLGYAILNYERARRLMPGDSDLRSNLDYARSLIEDGPYSSGPSFFMRILILPFRYLPLAVIALIVLALYGAFLSCVTLSFADRALGAKLRLLTAVIFITCVFAGAGFALRFNYDEARRSGIIVGKKVDCTYEPIDRSTTYFRIGEGNKVLILKTQGDWCRIRRADGKIGWLKKEDVAPI